MKASALEIIKNATKSGKCACISLGNKEALSLLKSMTHSTMDLYDEGSTVEMDISIDYDFIKGHAVIHGICQKTIDKFLHEIKGERV